MTDDCIHRTTMRIKFIKKSRKDVTAFFCMSCGKLTLEIEGQKLETQLYSTDEIREFLIDKLGEWYGRSPIDSGN